MLTTTCLQTARRGCQLPCSLFTLSQPCKGMFTSSALGSHLQALYSQKPYWKQRYMMTKEGSGKELFLFNPFPCRSLCGLKVLRIPVLEQIHCSSLHSARFFLTYMQTCRRSNWDHRVPARYFSLTCGYFNIFLFWLKTVITNPHGILTGRGFFKNKRWSK